MMMVVKVYCGTVFGDQFAALLKIRPQNCPTMQFETTRPSICHFEIARETRSGWLSNCIVGLFWGTNFQQGGKLVPENSPTIHFDNHHDPSPAQPQSGQLLAI